MISFNYSDLTCLTHFWPMFPFVAPKNTPKNLKLYKMGTKARNKIRPLCHHRETGQVNNICLIK